MNILLECKNVSKTHARGIDRQEAILSHISLNVDRGQFVSLMGPSGSGKSTLLYCISGMDQMSAGEVSFDRIELSTLREEELAKMRLNRMGFIFQQIYLLKNLSIFDNITLPGYLAKREPAMQVETRAHKLMERMQIAELADKDIMQASGGELQRASICRALINQPDILFGDEPTGALNSRSTSDIMDILLEVNQQGTTIFLVTHDVKVAAKTERVLYMSDGRVAGECHLGKYRSQECELKAREKLLSDWLIAKGF